MFAAGAAGLADWRLFFQKTLKHGKEHIQRDNILYFVNLLSRTLEALQVI